MNTPTHFSPPLPLPLDRAPRRLLPALALALLGACSGGQTMDSTIPPAGRPMWQQCQSSLSAWCHRQGQGDPTLDRECEENAAREYRNLADDPARRQYLSARTCAL